MTDTTISETTREYTVAGMSCSHCVASVREELGELSGVMSVDVELSSGRIVVTGSGVAVGAVRQAVADAGYAVV